MRRRDLLIAAPAIVLASALTRSAWAQEEKRWTGHVAGYVVARLKPEADAASIAAILKRHNAWPFRNAGQGAVPRLWRFGCPVGAEAALAEELMVSGLVLYAEPHFAPIAEAVPNDADYLNANAASNGRWGDCLRLNAAWDQAKLINYDYATMPNCFDIDSGVQGSFASPNFTPTHPDMDASVVVDSYNSLTGTTDVTPTSAHGTGTASLMGAIPNNSLNVMSAGWGGTVFPVRWDDIIAGVSWIADPANAARTHPERLGFINMSFVLLGFSQALVDAITAAYAVGFFTFASAGNNSASTCDPGPCDTPAPGVFGVAAISGVGPSPLAKTNYSNQGGPNHAGGVGCNLAMPGGGGGSTTNIPTLTTGSADALNSGTSYSAPIAAACARMLKVIRPGMSRDYLWSLLTDGTYQLSTSGFSPAVGAWDMEALVNKVFPKTPLSLVH